MEQPPTTAENALILDELSTLSSALRDTIERRHEGFLAKFPVVQYLDLFGNYPERAAYSFLSPATRALADLIQASGGTDLAALYNQVVLVELMKQNLGRVASSKLPPSIKAQYSRNFRRIIAYIAHDREERQFYSLTNDKYLKDLGVCNLRIIPAGAQKVNIWTLPVGALRRAGVRQLISAASYVITRMGGREPVLDMHTDSIRTTVICYPSSIMRVGSGFYLNVAELLKVFGRVRGVFGIGWVFDPRVAEISPRLAYLRTLPLENGGRIFCVGPSENARESALAKSATRRALFDQGKYTPTDYMAIWDRDSLIEWSRSSC